MTSEWFSTGFALFVTLSVCTNTPHSIAVSGKGRGGGEGKAAKTIFRVLRREEGKQPRALVMCQPVTGRTHQIRLHLQVIVFNYCILAVAVDVRKNTLMFVAACRPSGGQRPALRGRSQGRRVFIGSGSSSRNIERCRSIFVASVMCYQAPSS